MLSLDIYLLLLWRGTFHQDHCVLIDDYAKDGGEELFTKMHCVRIMNP